MRKFASGGRRMRRLKAAVLLLTLLGALSHLLMTGRSDLDAAPEVRRALRVARRYTRHKAPLPLPAAVQPAVPAFDQPDVPSAARRPNVIYIQHESLSGSIMLNTAKGQASTPFLQGRMENDPDFYVFEHQRTGSGNTIDALPAMMTGCLPFTKQGIEYVHAKGRSVGYEFKDQGYHTASFSSRGLDETITKQKWTMLYDILVGGMDRVEDAMNNPTIKRNNGQGSSDWQMLPLFEEWLAELDGKEGDAPFYAQFYNFNQHFPYLNSRKEPGKRFSPHWEMTEYYTSLRATDKFLKDLFGILSRTGLLANTIIIGSGDHGEDPFKKQYARLSALTSNIMHTAAYAYYPRHLMREGTAERLRRNTQRLTYTLDMHALVRSALHGGPTGAYLGHFMSDPHSASSLGCIGGIDLTSVEVPEDRVVLSMNLASSKIVHTGPLTLWGISTKEKTLYHRVGKHRVPPLGQGRHNQYVFHYGDCTRLVQQLCMTDVYPKYQEYFRRAIVNLRKYNKGFVGEEAKTSKLMEFFVLILGGEGAMGTTENAMQFERSFENSKAVEFRDGDHYSVSDVATVESAVSALDDATPQEAAPQEAAPQEATRSLLSIPSSLLSITVGSSSAGIAGDVSFDRREASGWKEASCENILVYMPDMLAHPSIEMQLNNYILAAMVATFMNLSMVILDAPRVYGDSELNSQFGCPKKHDKKPPPGLSRLLKVPEWLTSGCAVPCQQSHGYSDWEALRQSNKEGIPETVCTNDNGQQSNVFVLSAGEVSEYFKNHFKLPMLQRPSPVAYDWALRLGADPAEAEAFYRLKGKRIWDYLGALVARSDLLQFQKWILNDVAHRIRKLKLPANMPSLKERMGSERTWPFEAVHIRRGKDLLGDPKARAFIFNYWDSRGGYRGEHMNYIPLVHYLRHYHYQCSEYKRKVYIATGDPEEVTRELADVSREIDGGQRKIGCNAFQFNFLEGYGGTDSCVAGYSETIASIADFITFIKVRTFVGDFNSDWGKLIRTFRLKLTREGTSNGDVISVSLPGTEVGWGTMPPPSLPGW